MRSCSICGEEEGSSLEGWEFVHLDLYVVGSEGIKVCLTCRMVLTEVAKRMKEVANHAYLRGIHRGKKL